MTHLNLVKAVFEEVRVSTPARVGLSLALSWEGGDSLGSEQQRVCCDYRRKKALPPPPCLPLRSGGPGLGVPKGA